MRSKWILIGQSFLKTMRTIGDKKIPSRGGRTRTGSERDRARNHGRFWPARCILWAKQTPNMIFENSSPEGIFGPSMSDSPNWSLTANSRSLQAAALNCSEFE